MYNKDISHAGTELTPLRNFVELFQQRSPHPLCCSYVSDPSDSNNMLYSWSRSPCSRLSEFRSLQWRHSRGVAEGTALLLLQSPWSSFDVIHEVHLDCTSSRCGCPSARFMHSQTPLQLSRIRVLMCTRWCMGMRKESFLFSARLQGEARRSVKVLPWKKAGRKRERIWELDWRSAG